MTHKYGEEYTSQVNTFNKIKAKAAVKDANRILGYPFSLGDRITKAMPPDVMGKGFRSTSSSMRATGATRRARNSAICTTPTPM